MLRRYARIILFVVCGLLLALMVLMSDPSLLWNYMVQIRWGLCLCLLTWAVVYILNALSWASVISTFRPCPERECSGRLSAMKVLQLTITGYSLNYITPFGLLGGEPYRVFELKKYLGVEAATSSVTLYAMMHVCSHFLLWIIGSVVAAFAITDISYGLMALLIAVAIICVAVILLFFMVYRRGLIVRVLQVLSKAPIMGHYIRKWNSKHTERLQTIDNGISALLLEHPREFYFSLGMELIARMVNAVEIVFLLGLLGYGYSYTDGLLILAFSSLFANLLFFSPLQMGTREGGILMVLQLLHPELALSALLPLSISISFATRIREFFWIAVGILLMSLNRNNSKTNRTSIEK